MAAAAGLRFGFDFEFTARPHKLCQPMKASQFIKTGRPVISSYDYHCAADFRQTQLVQYDSFGRRVFVFSLLCILAIALPFNTEGEELAWGTSSINLKPPTAT